MSNLQLSFRQIVDILFDCNHDVDIVVNVISTNYSDISQEKLQNFHIFLVKTLIPRFKSKWLKSNRTKSRFFMNNEEWLSCSMYSFSEDYVDTDEPICSNEVKRGRPAKSFEDCKERSKRSKIQKLCDNTSADLITSAAKQLNKEDMTYTKFTPEKALSIILDAKLSKFQYEVLRNATKENNVDIFPSYKKVSLVVSVYMFVILLISTNNH